MRTQLCAAFGIDVPSFALLAEVLADGAVRAIEQLHEQLGAPNRVGER